MDRVPTGTKVVRGMMYNFMGMNAIVIVGLATSIIIVRLLGKETYGLLAIIFNSQEIISLLVSFGWVGAAMLVCKHNVLRPMTRTLAAVGRMAFTNYLMQTVICTTIFYGHGMGLFGRFTRTQLVLVVLVIWVFLLIASPMWLRRYRFGPAEWLWRSLTHGARQPMRRESGLLVGGGGAA